MRCKGCLGYGQVCDACDAACNPYRTCEHCGGDYCSMLAAEDIDGEPTTIGVRDCFTGHECIVRVIEE